MGHDLDWLRRMEQHMRHWADESIRDVMGQAFFGEAVWVPRVDIYETDEALIVKVCAAGVDPEATDIALSGDGRQLVVRGIRGESHDSGECLVRYHQIEIYTGRFERTIDLPEGITVDKNQVTASAADGFFRICLPKIPREELAPRSVPIKQE